jgi:hypothetical protein
MSVRHSQSPPPPPPTKYRPGPAPTFFENRRDSAIWNCGMYAGLAGGWMIEPFVRWSLMPIFGEPPLPFPLFQTVAGLVLSVWAALIIQGRDNEQRRLDALPPIEERDE